jgi:hypothetical protein
LVVFELCEPGRDRCRNDRGQPFGQLVANQHQLGVSRGFRSGLGIEIRALNRLLLGNCFIDFSSTLGKKSFWRVRRSFGRNPGRFSGLLLAPSFTLLVVLLAQPS